jgi:hypothetical protein
MPATHQAFHRGGDDADEVEVRVLEQVDRLIAAGVAEVAGISAKELAAHATDLPDVSGAVLAVHPRLASPSRLAPLVRRRGRPGFVVEDMTDVDAFAPIDGLEVPDLPLYLLTDPVRGDDLRATTPIEGLAAIRAAGRTPITLNEGISWLLQDPSVLQPGACFMTLGSAKRTTTGPDARTPAIWISGGTGRDGAARRGAPKVGWCWAGNRHTWLGHASSAARLPVDQAAG